MNTITKTGFFRVLASFSLAALTLIGVSGCGGSNPSAPGIQRVFLDDGTVAPGSEVTLYVELFLEAHDAGAENRQTDPFSVAITLPPGASYVPGTAGFSFQPVREPDATGSCGDGRTFLLFNFVTGEVDNSYNFKELADDLGIRVLVTQAADDQVAAAVADPLPIADPCQTGSGEETSFNVQAS